MVEMINRKAVMEGLTVTASFDDGSDRILLTESSGGALSADGVANSDMAIDLGLAGVAGVATLQSTTLTLDAGPGPVDEATRLAWLENNVGTAGLRFSTVTDNLLILGTSKGVYQAFNPRTIINGVAGGAAALRPVANAAVELVSLVAGRPGEVRIEAITPGSLWNGVTVEFVAGAAGAPEARWNVLTRTLQVRINDGTTTDVDIVAAINGADIVKELFVASSVTNGLVGTAVGSLSGGLQQHLPWTKVGQKLPTSQVVEINYDLFLDPVTGIFVNNHWTHNNAGDLKGGVLVAGTRGRGAWEISDFALQDIQERPELVITSSPGAQETVSLALSRTNPWILEIFMNEVIRGRYDISNIHTIRVNGEAGDDILAIDAGIYVPGGIIFDAGAIVPKSIIKVFGKSDVQTLPTNEYDAASHQGIIQVEEGGRILLIQYVNAASAAQVILSADIMAMFQAGLAALVQLSDVNDALSRESIPFIGKSLSQTVTGNPPSARLQPIGIPSNPDAPTKKLIDDLAALGLTLDDLEGNNTIIGRFLNSGPLGDFLAEIGHSIPDYDALEQTLDNLDGTAGNVDYTEAGDVVTFDMTIIKRFAGEGKIDVDALGKLDIDDPGGLLTLKGEVVYSFDINLHLVFGVDSAG
jgi:hypothetical protein